MTPRQEAVDNGLTGLLPCDRCRYWHEGGGCEWGDDCPFIVDDDRSEFPVYRDNQGREHQEF